MSHQIKLLLCLISLKTSSSCNWLAFLFSILIHIIILSDQFLFLCMMYNFFTCLQIETQNINFQQVNAAPLHDVPLSCHHLQVNLCSLCLSIQIEAHNINFLYLDSQGSVLYLPSVLQE
jgi:hypothetical protein